LKERDDPKAEPVSGYLTAITSIGLGGLGIMLGGAIAMKNGAQFPEELIGIFMLMTFAIICVIEIFLCRQLSRLMSDKRNVNNVARAPAAMPQELRGPQPRALPDPVPSVTENTTRTLDYSRNEPPR
jgi:hypothetical protein